MPGMSFTCTAMRTKHPNHKNFNKMHHFCFIFFGIFGCSNSFAALTALNDSPHALKLYLDIRDVVESYKTDIAASNAQIRKQICKDIVDNEWFHLSGEVALDEEELWHGNYDDHEKYQDVLNQIYNIQKFDNPIQYKYINPYRRRQFRILSEIYEECVFLCLGTSGRNPGEIYSKYVSKEYNVSSIRSDELMYKPGRFVFPIFDPKQAPNELKAYDDIILVEEPATVHQSPDFNVELHYLRIRRYVEQSADGHDTNPLCTLISEDVHDPKNQHYRFCVSITRSSAFMKRTIHPPNEPYLCVRKEISFKTKDGIERAPATPYTELVAPCYMGIPGGDRFLYISRAYMSNQVFVYQYSIANEKLYLVNLSRNISILDELNSFDLIED